MSFRRRFRPWGWMWAAWTALGCLHAGAQSTPSDEHTLSRWVHQLGSTRFSVREQAERGLEQHLLQAEPLLLAVEFHEDLEVRTRVRRLLNSAAEERVRQAPPGYEVAWRKPRTMQAAGQVDDPWLCGSTVLFHRDADLEAVDLSTGATRWQTPSPKHTTAYATVDVCQASVATFDGRQFRVLETDTGRERWQAVADAGVRHWFMNKELLFALSLRKFLAFRVATGQPVFEQPLESPVFPMGCGPGGAAVWTHRTNRLLVYGCETGELRAKLEVERPGGVSFLDDHRMMLVDSVGKSVQAVDLRTGASLWTRLQRFEAAPSQWWKAVECRNQHLAFHGRLWSADTGELCWEHELPGPKVKSIRWSDLLAQPASRWFVRPTFEGSTVYFPTGAGQVHAVDVASGRKRWTWEVDDDRQACRVQAQDPYLVVSTDSQVIALRRSSWVEPRPVLAAEVPPTEPIAAAPASEVPPTALAVPVQRTPTLPPAAVAGPTVDDTALLEDDAPIPAPRSTPRGNPRGTQPVPRSAQPVDPGTASR